MLCHIFSKFIFLCWILWSYFDVHNFNSISLILWHNQFYEYIFCFYIWTFFSFCLTIPSVLIWSHLEIEKVEKPLWKTREKCDVIKCDKKSNTYTKTKNEKLLFDFDYCVHRVLPHPHTFLLTLLLLLLLSAFQFDSIFL